MNLEDIKAKIEKALAGVSLKTVRESLLIEKPSDLPKVVQFLKEDPDLRLDYLSSVTGADYLTFLESVYHLYSIEKKGPGLTLRVRADRNNPRIPSLVSIYRGAEFQEREAFDMYGIVYENHPDLRRIFMWDGFQGYPLRKDYEQEDSETLEMEDIDWLRRNKVQVPDEMTAQAEKLKQEGKRAIAQRPGETEPQ